MRTTDKTTQRESNLMIECIMNQWDLFLRFKYYLTSGVTENKEKEEKRKEKHNEMKHKIHNSKKKRFSNKPTKTKNLGTL